MASSDTFVKKIQDTAADCLAIIDRAEARGYFTADESHEVDRCEFSQLKIYEIAHELACEYEGKRARQSILTPDSDVRSRKGLHVSNAGDRPAIYIYGPIGHGDYQGISAEDVQSKLTNYDSHEQIDVHVHSDGGSFLDATAIYTLFKDRSGDVFGYIDGLAASAASILLMACTTITMAKASRQMVHYASVSGDGSLDEVQLARRLKVVRETNESILGLYLPRWRGTKGELDEALRAETYYTAPQAVAVGFADHISETARVAPYTSISSGRNSSEFAIAASARRTGFATRRATFKLWQLAADEITDNSSRRS